MTPLLISTKTCSPSSIKVSKGRLHWVQTYFFGVWTLVPCEFPDASGLPDVDIPAAEVDGACWLSIGDQVTDRRWFLECVSGEGSHSG